MGCGRAWHHEVTKNEAVRVIQGTAARSRQSAIEAAYDHFRVDRQGNLVSANTLDHYHYLVSPFFDWLREVRPDVERFEDLDVNVVRDYRLALTSGRVELRVRWDAGAKGWKSRRVPITPSLASAIKRYQARHRRPTDVSTLLISERGSPYTRFGIDDMMDRLEARVRFRVHAHGFRHTFATVATKLGWNFEHLRAAMGHASYAMLQRYVRLASERDLGSRKD